MSLPVQQNDDRYHDPAISTSPQHDINGVLAALLLAYLNYSPPSAVGEMAEEDEIAIYPNPTTTQVIVRTKPVKEEGEPCFTTYKVSCHCFRFVKTTRRQLVVRKGEDVKYFKRTSSSWGKKKGLWSKLNIALAKTTPSITLFVQA